MRRALPPLGGLRAFEAAARHCSFRDASDELGVTQSAVSHQIAALEAALEVKLFERHTRQVCLTPAGAMLQPFCREAFDQLARGAQLVRRLKGSGVLMVETYATILVRWLLPRLPAFRAQAPQLTLRFGASQSDWELDIGDADVAILWTLAAGRTGFDHVPLGRARLVPVCSPALAETLGPDPDPSAIGTLPRLSLHTAGTDWSAWLAAAAIAPASWRASVEFDTYLSAIEAALHGQGVALAPHFLVADDLAAGRLRAPFATTAEQPGGWYLVHRSQQRDDPRVQTFTRWVVGEMARVGPIIQGGAETVSVTMSAVASSSDRIPGPTL